ncbi:MAG: NAD(P)/FAD-dependent oxidoreductase [Caulobacteraceae bacterium]
MTHPSRPRVVIVGGGFGGMDVARALARAPVDVTVVDKANHHTFQPLLYQVATAALSPADIAWPIRALLAGQKNARTVMAEVTAIDTDRRVVKTRQIDLPYDWLVIATGARPSYFGHDAWAPFAPELKRIEDATAIRQKLLTAFEYAEIAGDDARRSGLLTFVVVGGGATGVEMAGAIAEVAKSALPPDFATIDTGAARVILIEAGPRLLPTFAASLSAYAGRALAKMGVEVMTGVKVTGCDAAGVTLGDARIAARTIIWAAGVRASPAARWLSVEGDREGRVPVSPDLTVPGHPEVFVIGDTASIHDGAGKAVPGLAAAAKQMGKYAGRAISAHVAGAAAPDPFRYRDEGSLAVIGRKAAVVDLGWLRLTGAVGWLFWSAVHIYFLIGLRNRVIVALTWLWSYATGKRGAWLILGGEPS